MKKLTKGEIKKAIISCFDVPKDGAEDYVKCLDTDDIVQLTDFLENENLINFSIVDRTNWQGNDYWLQAESYKGSVSKIIDYDARGEFDNLNDLFNYLKRLEEKS